MDFLRRVKQWLAMPTHSVLPLDDAAWADYCAAWPLLRRMPAAEALALRAMSDQFLASKYLEGVRGLALTAEMQRVIALFACLPVLHLGLEWYKDWNNIFVTADSFRETRQSYQAGGVISESEEELSGEVLEFGPVVLSWEDIREGGQGRGFQVVIHEMAHKLDGRNGQDLDGMPPLSAADRAIWQPVFSETYQEFCRQVTAAERGLTATARSRLARLPLDDYAAESPAEFFAVACEAFFDRSLRLRGEWPAVYDCLRRFFGMDPAEWI